MKGRNNLYFIITMFAVLALSLSVLAVAQAPVLVRRADMSIPFGTAYGKIVVISDHLVFVDEDMPDSSFSIARSEIRSIQANGEMLMIETKRPVRDRTGERSQFSFRLRDGSSEALTLWAGTQQMTSPASTQTASVDTVTTTTTPVENVEPVEWTYNAKHNHRLGVGSCTGKLIISKDRVVYESLENREHTRQWPLNDIKKVKRNSPYKFEIETFSRGDYSLEIEGMGVDISVHKKLEEWIADARSR